MMVAMMNMVSDCNSGGDDSGRSDDNDHDSGGSGCDGGYKDGSKNNEMVMVVSLVMMMMMLMKVMIDQFSPGKEKVNKLLLGRFDLWEARAKEKRAANRWSVVLKNEST